MPSGPASRSTSAAASPAAHTPPAPCTPAAAPIGKCAILLHRRQQPLPARRSPRRCSRPPIACPQRCPPALPLPLPSLLRTPPAAPRSLPTRSGIHGSSPENRSAPETQCSRPAAISPGPPSCTFALHQPLRMDQPETAPLSAPAGSDTLALLPLPRCTTLPPPPPALAPSAHPICKSACSRSVFQSGSNMTLLWVRLCQTCSNQLLSQSVRND